MKKVRLLIKEKDINRKVRNEFLLFLYDNATILYAIDKIDWVIRRKVDKFPVKEFESLLHMTYNPKERRFYEQVIMHASTPTSKFVNIRQNVGMKLPDEVNILMILYPMCGHPEVVLNYDEFIEKVSKDENLKFIKTNLKY